MRSDSIILALLSVLLAFYCYADQIADEKNAVAVKLDYYGRCSGGRFPCSGRHLCIPASYKCDYDNDCGNHQDERNCNEKCDKWHTIWQNGGHGKLLYLFKHHLHCRNGGSMKSFKLQRAGQRIRYEYTCCKLNKKVCRNTMKYNTFTYSVPQDGANFLDRQLVNCGPYGYVSSLQLRRNSYHNKIQYFYNCCRPTAQKHRTRSSCYSDFTRWTPSHYLRSYYLAAQTVGCKNRYFLNAFQLNNRYPRGQYINTYYRYYYRCCRIKS